jgi:hypothetical protein
MEGRDVALQRPRAVQLLNIGQTLNVTSKKPKQRSPKPETRKYPERSSILISTF